MTGSPPVIIAEAGVNHCGDADRARDMVRAAAAAGADYVKFQAFRTDEIVAPEAATAAYQSAHTGLARQADLLRDLELSVPEIAMLADACAESNIRFLCTPFDVEVATALVDMGMDHIKVPSGELNNLPYLRQIGNFGLPVFLSTGMGTLEEVRHAIAVLASAGAGEITALHCTSLYPAPAGTINLRAMITMRDALGVPVGYSDHSLGSHVAIAAAALGATVIEKHFTLDRSLPGPDHAASLEPAELADMITHIRETRVALGNGVKAPAPEELETARKARRSWHAARDLAAGTVIAIGDAVLKRPADGLPADAEPEGRRLLRPVAANAPIADDDLAQNLAKEAP